MENALEISGTAATTRAPSRVVLVSARREARRLVRRLGRRPWSGLPIVGFVDTGHSLTSSMRLRSRHLALHPETEPVPVLGPIDRLDELVDRARATHVMVAVSPETDASPAVPMSPLLCSDVGLQWVLVDSGRLNFE